MPDRSRRRPRDPSQLGKLIVDLATGDAKEPDPGEDKNPAAVASGRKGGLKGGKVRSERLTREQKRASAKKAAAARWSHSRQG
jgi:hypothetical protein